MIITSSGPTMGTNGDIYAPVYVMVVGLGFYFYFLLFFKKIKIRRKKLLLCAHNNLLGNVQMGMKLITLKS